MIAEEKIAEIKQVARISDFISPHVPLKRRGRSLLGLCPFHTEKTPSFSVNDDNGFYHCFGCSAGGNVFKFLMEIEQLSFPEAVRKVADRYGISVPESDEQRRSAKPGYFEITASAARYFRRFLFESDRAGVFLDYLRGRGISEKAAATFALGAAPPSGQGLVTWLAREGGELGLAQHLGLVSDRGGTAYDRFRNRLMFPIRDGQGRVLGFGGRLLGEDDGPKYLNSPESDIYHKSRVLYGIYEAREAMRSSDTMILVEGYFDVIALADAGVANVVATCGTALTIDQARIIRRFASDVVILFDGDEAGRRASARSFPILIEAGLWPRGTSLPSGEDPDSYVRSNGAEALRTVVAEAAPLVEDYARYVAEAAPPGASGMARVGAELARVLAKVSDPFEYDLLVRKAAHWTGISAEVLRTEGRRAMRGARASQARADARGPATSGASATKGGAPSAEELLVAVLLTDGECICRADERDVIKSMEPGIWQALTDDMIKAVRAGGAVDTADIIERLPQPYGGRMAAKLLEDSLADQAIRERIFDDCIRRIEERARRRHNRQVVESLRKIEDLGTVSTATEQLAKWRPRKSSDA